MEAQGEGRSYHNRSHCYCQPTEVRGRNGFPHFPSGHHHTDCKSGGGLGLPVRPLGNVRAEQTERGFMDWWKFWRKKSSQYTSSPLREPKTPAQPQLPNQRHTDHSRLSAGSRSAPTAAPRLAPPTAAISSADWLQLVTWRRGGGALAGSRPGRERRADEGGSARRGRAGGGGAPMRARGAAAAAVKAEPGGGREPQRGAGS